MDMWVSLNLSTMLTIDAFDTDVHATDVHEEMRCDKYNRRNFKTCLCLSVDNSDYSSLPSTVVPMYGYWAITTCLKTL